MTAHRFHTQGRDYFARPIQSDRNLQAFGNDFRNVQPMREPTWLDRILGRV